MEAKGMVGRQEAERPRRFGGLFGNRGILRKTDTPPRGQTITIPRPPPVEEEIIIIPGPPKVSPPPPTEEPSLGQGLAETLRKIAKSKATKIIGAAVALTSPFAVQHHVQTHEELSPQGVTRDVGAIPSTAEKDFNFFLQKLGLRSATENISVPIVYDNLADKGVIGDSNSIKLSQAEIDQQFPTAFGKLGDGKNTLQFEHILDTTTSNNPTTQIVYQKSFSGTTFAEREQYKELGFYDTYKFQNVQGGTTIKSPVDGFVTMLIEPPIAPNGADGKGVLIDFVGPNGSQYRIIIGGYTAKDFQDGDPSTKTGYVFKSLVEDMPTATPDINKKPIGSYGISVKKGDGLLQLIQTRDGKPIEGVSFNIVMARKGEVGKPFNLSDPTIPTNIEFFTTPEGKLISPSR